MRFRKSWSSADDELLRQRYGTVKCADLAAELGRTTHAVYNRALELGVVTRRRVVSDLQIRQAIGRYYPLGYSDAEIAQCLRKETGLPADRHRVGRMRRHMQLGNTRLTEYQRGRVRNKTNEVLAAKGWQSLAHVRSARHREFIRGLGWPESLSLRSAMVATLLWQRGPMTRLEICAAMGLQNPHRTDPKSNRQGGTAMAELIRAGIVVGLQKAKRGDGRGRAVNVYLIAPGVVPNEQHEEDSESNDRGKSSDAAGAMVGHCELANQSAGGRDQQHYGRRRAADRRKTTREGERG